MATESEVKLARYNTIEKEADKFGRVIGVRRLKPSERTRIVGMTPDLAGSEDVTLPTGEKAAIPQRAELIVAAMVCMIDDSRIPFPRNRGELDAIYDRLDSEGLAAATTAFVRLSDAEQPITKDDAKN